MTIFLLNVAGCFAINENCAGNAFRSGNKGERQLDLVFFHCLLKGNGTSSENKQFVEVMEGFFYVDLTIQGSDGGCFFARI